MTWGTIITGISLFGMLSLAVYEARFDDFIEADKGDRETGPASFLQVHQRTPGTSASAAKKAA
ncbi:MAG: hypothetical protein EPO64_07875 [Nitrospirae bacterium]|nr:MAG: hypothetical protein EPO64_07875 [Nitrospirota bacterium]